MQCFKGKLAEEADWAAACHMEQSLKADVSAAPSVEQKAAQPAESERKLLNSQMNKAETSLGASVKATQQRGLQSP